MTGGPLEDVYVYVENVKMPLTHHKVMEIEQEGRQFNPRVAVVQTGTNLMFPNMDAVYHNVFSNSPRNSFDLGTYQAGDKARSVTVDRSGRGRHLLQHSSEDVGEGAGRAERALRQGAPRRNVSDRNVPPGFRRLVAWSPETKVESQKVAVNGPTPRFLHAGARDASAHANKFGQAYGSYRD